MKSLKNIELDKKKILLLILTCALVIYLEFSVFIKAQIKSIMDFEFKIKELNGRIESLTRDLTKLQLLKPGLKEGIGFKKFIMQDEIPALLENISAVANKNEIKIMSVEPSKAQSAKEEGVILMALDLTGDYHSLGKFINDLENREEFLSVESLEITSQPADYLKQRLNLVLKTYVKK